MSSMMNEKSLKKPLLMISRALRYRIFGTSLTVGIALILVTGIAIAGVFVVFTYPSTTTPASPTIYLEQGTNYANAYALGLVSGGAGPNKEITSATSIDINGVSGAGDTYLLNVFEVVNSSSGTKGNIYLYINASLPSGVTLYWDNTTEMTFSGTSSGTYSIVQGPDTTGKSSNGNGTIPGSGTYINSGPIPLTANKASTPYTLYISFLVAGTVTGTGTLYLQVSVP